MSVMHEGQPQGEEAFSQREPIEGAVPGILLQSLILEAYMIRIGAIDPKTALKDLRLSTRQVPKMPIADILNYSAGPADYQGQEDID